MAKKLKNNTKKIKLKKGRIVLTVFLVVAILLATSGIYLGVKIYKETEGFDAQRLAADESSTQIAANGDVYYTHGSSGSAKNVTYDDLPQVLIDAVVSAEDSRFFEHDGFDLPRIVKAFMGNLAAGRITGGGSTITQQLIKKSYYPDEQRTIERKVGEVVLSIQASKEITKQKVLELYLNKIYFGVGPKTIGIYAASLYYFDKAVQNLTLPEAALLAGALNSPNSYDPFANLKRAQERRDTILNLMCTHGYITEEERDKTKAIPVQNTLKSNPVKTGGEYQAYADMVTREVYEKTGLDPNYTGMKIYTYMDKDIQSMLDDIASGESYSFNDKYLQAGAVVQETQHGRVVGVLSARNYTAMGTTYAYAGDKEKVANNELSSYGQRNQPGSSLKPIIAYASAFEFLNYSTAHYVHDVPIEVNGHVAKNWDNNYHGDVSIKEALYQSWNAAAQQTLSEVLNEVGTEKMINYMEGFGFDMYDEQDFTVGYSIGGWTTGVSPQESANAYATISNGGTYYESHTVEKIEIIATGEVIYIDKEAEQNKTRAISEESAFMIRQVMTGYVNESLGQYGVFNLGYQIGAKSGTTNNSADTWMTGYSPDYAWAVWVGYPSTERENGRVSVSGHDARSIAVLIAKSIHSNGLTNSYNKPSGVEQAKVVTGIYPYVSPGEGIPSSRITTGWFKKGYGPSSSASASSKVPNLSSFTASLSGSKIKVKFAKYESSSSGTKTYKVGGKSYTLPYLGDISAISGTVSYTVEVTDSTGKVVHTETLKSNTGTLNYTPTAGTYTVTGYYSSGDNTSNKINNTITVKGDLNASISVNSVTENSASATITIPSNSSINITISDSNGNALKSQTLNSSQTITISELTPGTSYTISGTVTTADGQSKSVSKSFTTSASSTPEHEDDDNHHE